MVIHLGANRAIGAEQILLCTDITQGWAADTEKMVRAMQEKHRIPYADLILDENREETNDEEHE